MNDDAEGEPPDLVITAGGLAPDGETWEERGRRIVAAAEVAIREARVTEQVVGSLCDQGVALLLERGDTATDRVLVTIKGIRPYGGSIEQLRKSLARMTREARGFRVVGADESTSVRQAVGAPEGWPDYPVPEGWQATARGIAQLERQGEATIANLVAHDPILVTGLRVDAGSGRESVVLGFRRHGRWREVAVPREIARDARGLIALSAQGVPVSSVTSKALVSWLDDCEAAGRGVLEVRSCATRTGWHGDTFVAGPGGEIELDDPEGVRSGWGACGTWEGWLEGLEAVEGEPAPWLVMFTVCVGPLLRWMPLGHCPILDLFGPRGRGKTTCLRLGGSVFGRPDEHDGGTITTWDATRTFIERLAACTWDAPLLLDDTRRAEDPEMVGPTVYSLAQGRGRGRGTIAGLQRTATWRLVVVSTGEAPLIEATEAGGARARVLSVGITPAISSLAAAKALEGALVANHGHLGPRVAARALELGAELAERYRSALVRWSRIARADTRLLSTCAAIEVAHSVCREVGVPEPQADWRTALVEALQQSVVAGDQAGRALELVREDLARFPAAYQVQPDQREPPGGWHGMARLGADWVGVYPGVLHRLLHEARHDATPVITQWIEQGVLRRNKGNLFRTRLESVLTPAMYAFHRSELLPDQVRPPAPSDEWDD